MFRPLSRRQRSIAVNNQRSSRPATQLCVGPSERAALAALRETAANHPVDIRGILERLKNPRRKRQHMTQMTQQTIPIPSGFMVTFSIEIGHPGGSARHMSMSSRPGRVPLPEAVWMIAEELGFVGGLRQCMVWVEDLQGHGKAVNVAQLISPTGAPSRA